MDVPAVSEYLETRKHRAELEKRLSRLIAELDIAQTKEAELSGKVDPDSLITAKSVKVINTLLTSHCPLWLNDYPLSFAHVALKNGKLRLSVIFAQPIFTGWRTEVPYKSWQSVKWSLETPELPSESHIPQYTQVVDQELSVVCWERDGSELRLWQEEGSGILFHWESVRET